MTPSNVRNVPTTGTQRQREGLIQELPRDWIALPQLQIFYIPDQVTFEGQTFEQFYLRFR